MQIDLQTQEYFGWIGNFIFCVAQMFQIYHTYRIKTTKDISYGLQILFFVGDAMYTVFGAIDNSLSMLVGNAFSTFLCVIQISQKVYYDKYYVRHIGYERIGTNYQQFADDE